MSYERYDTGSTQSGVRHTAPNVDRVMGLGSTQETTVDRLLTVVERLTAELATTQNALHDLALEVARAGLGSGRPGTAPAVGYGTGVPAVSSGTVPLTPRHPSALPPRQADHAVISELDQYVPGQHAPAAQHGGYAPAHDGQGPGNGHGPVEYEGPDAEVTPLPSDAPESVPESSDAHAEDTSSPLQRRAAEASAAAAAAAAQAAAAAAQPVDPHAPPGAGPSATYGGPTTPPAATQAGFDTSTEVAPRADLVASLNDVQLLSAGAVDVTIGPVRDLADLDALESRILALPSVEAVTVMAFEGRDVLVKIEIERPLPLASMLRTELGRPVESCRLVEGRIVVTFADEEPAA